MTFEFWVCNDTPERAEGAPVALADRAGWSCHLRPAGAGRPWKQYGRPSRGSSRTGAPQVEERTRYTLRLALADGDEDPARHAIEYEVFPALPSPGTRCRSRSSVQARRRQLMRRTGRERGRDNPVSTSRGRLCRIRATPDTIDSAVAAGARAVFLELPVGEYEVGVRRCASRSV